MSEITSNSCLPPPLPPPCPHHAIDRAKAKRATRPPSAYNLFMKDQLAPWKLAHPEADHAAAFKAVAGMWATHPSNPVKSVACATVPSRGFIARLYRATVLIVRVSASPQKRKNPAAPATTTAPVAASAAETATAAAEPPKKKKKKKAVAPAAPAPPAAEIAAESSSKRKKKKKKKKLKEKGRAL